MTVSGYPFDSQFQLAVEKDSRWWTLLSAKDEADLELRSKPLEKAGYSYQMVKQYIGALKAKNVDELIALALRDNNDESPALAVLRHDISDEVFQKSQQLCSSENPAAKNLGVRLLMYMSGSQFKAEATKTVINLALLESDSSVLETIAYAMCQLEVDERSQYLERVAASPDAATRLAVASSLSLLADDLAVKLLIKLSSDPDANTRNWATFGLQLSKENLPNQKEILDALFARIHDSDNDTRHEALVGLAHYKDQRVIEPLIEALSSETIWELSIEAAEAIGDERLYPYLLELRSWWDGDTELLDKAIAACAPGSETS